MVGAPRASEGGPLTNNVPAHAIGTHRHRDGRVAAAWRQISGPPCVSLYCILLHCHSLHRVLLLLLLWQWWVCCADARYAVLCCCRGLTGPLQHRRCLCRFCVQRQQRDHEQSRDDHPLQPHPPAKGSARSAVPAPNSDLCGGGMREQQAGGCCCRGGSWASERVRGRAAATAGGRRRRSSAR